MIFIAVRFIIFALEKFHDSKTSDKSGDASGKNLAERFNFYTAQFWAVAGINSLENPISKLSAAIAKTLIGQFTLIRLGMPPKEYEIFIKQYPSKNVLKNSEFLEKLEKDYPDKEITFGNIVAALFETDETVHNFFFSQKINDKTLLNAAFWAESALSKEDSERRWWLPEHLARIPGIAASWAYGHTPTLEKFSSDLRYEISGSPLQLIGHEREIRLLESALLKQEGANAIIVGEPGTGKNTILLGLAQMIMTGKVFSQLESKRIFKLFGPSITASAKTKGETEELLITLFNETAKAGDIIIVLEDFPEFVKSLSDLGVSASQILGPYLSSRATHFIALANTSSFRKVLERDAALMKYFEKIEIFEPDESSLIEILKDVAPLIERGLNNKIIVTYQALEKIAESAIKYIVTGALPERAINILQESAAEAASRKTVFIDSDFILNFVSKKTNMPLGEISGKEQEKLLDLEKILHKRVIGQDEAVISVADAVKRARAGIRDPKKPIGTFLFLGPTGVGKTETAKTLAETYFGNEEAMIRFDMTEYQTEEGLAKLTGSLENNEPGILSSRVRSTPYSVVLLDEFEKAHSKVIDLFLQVLDEGFFSDAFGQKINMKNTIIIATSNAGSNMIWELVKTGVSPSGQKEQIIFGIRKEGKFKPELLNRFDSIIIFRPLESPELRKIARLMLQKLASRLKEQEINLEITDNLVEAVVKNGYDPAFGARPMRRFIQEKIEKTIADKIISGDIKRGSDFSFSEKDI